MSQESKNTARKTESITALADIIEVKSKFVREYADEVLRARYKKIPPGNSCARTVDDGALVFTVLDDKKLYGIAGVEEEFATREFDPYCLYKRHQRLASIDQVADNHPSEVLDPTSVIPLVLI